LGPTIYNPDQEPLFKTGTHMKSGVHTIRTTDPLYNNIYYTF
jgi:hypothetical protein